jgi:hypothetical protein
MSTSPKSIQGKREGARRIRRTRKKERRAIWQAVLAGLLLGISFAAVEIEAPGATSSQATLVLQLVFITATLLVASAFTKRASTGLLCGLAATASHLLSLLLFYTYSYTFPVAVDAVIPGLLGMVAYPLAGVIGGYLADRSI